MVTFRSAKASTGELSAQCTHYAKGPKEAFSASFACDPWHKQTEGPLSWNEGRQMCSGERRSRKRSPASASTRLSSAALASGSSSAATVPMRVDASPAKHASKTANARRVPAVGAQGHVLAVHAVPRLSFECPK